MCLVVQQPFSPAKSLVYRCIAYATKLFRARRSYEARRITVSHRREHEKEREKETAGERAFRVVSHFNRSLPPTCGVSRIPPQRKNYSMARRLTAISIDRCIYAETPECIAASCARATSEKSLDCAPTTFSRSPRSDRSGLSEVSRTSRGDRTSSGNSESVHAFSRASSRLKRKIPYIRWRAHSTQVTRYSLQITILARSRYQTVLKLTSEAQFVRDKLNCKYARHFTFSTSDFNFKCSLLRPRASEWRGRDA